VALENKITLEAVQAVVETAITPGVPLILPETPTEAFEPAVIRSLFPAVPRTRLPLVAVMAPRVAVRLVPAVIAALDPTAPVRVMPPDPALMVTDVVPVVFPNVFTLAPVVAKVVAPVLVSVVKEPPEPDASSLAQVADPPDLETKI
jgi:hypothetical protein